MMKRFVLSTMILLASVATFAQRHRTGISIQPKIGLNVADLTNSNANNKVGLAVGAEFEFPTTRQVSFTAGAIYSQQGVKNVDLGYINVPVLANFYVAQGFALKMGLQPGFNVNDDNIEHVNAVDLSIPVGMSYTYNNFVFDARYNIGVTKAIEYTKCKNSVFQLTFGYKIPLK